MSRVSIGRGDERPSAAAPGGDLHATLSNLRMAIGFMEKFSATTDRGPRLLVPMCAMWDGMRLEIGS
ncbi:hypothetical protein JW905_07495 [bacterium]|nr:hypothetical protein [candidate division CSSED10-310 bacterium]